MHDRPVTDLATAAPRDHQEVAPEPGSRRPVALVALGGFSVFAVALAVTFAVLWAQSSKPSSQDVSAALNEASPRVAKNATAVATLLMNYDAANLDDVSNQLLELSTGNFREDYQDVLTGGLGDALEKAGASSRGQILDGPDVYFKSSDEAVALMRLSQTTQSAEAPGGQSFVYVMKITLVETEAGGWRADRVEILSQERT